MINGPAAVVVVVAARGGGASLSGSSFGFGVATQKLRQLDTTCLNRERKLPLWRPIFCLRRQGEHKNNENSNIRMGEPLTRRRRRSKRHQQGWDAQITSRSILLARHQITTLPSTPFGEKGWPH